LRTALKKILIASVVVSPNRLNICSESAFKSPAIRRVMVAFLAMAAGPLRTVDVLILLEICKQFHQQQQKY